MSSGSTEQARPQTSTRDLGELRARLEQWMATRIPGGAPHISALDTPSATGMSSETVLFDATWTEDGVERAESLVARVAPEASAVPVFRDYDLPAQFETMRLVAEHSDVPVPKVYWCEPDPGPLGAPFFVMERIEGRVPPDLMPYNFGDTWVFDASKEELDTLQDASVAVLAGLHGIEDAERIFGFLAIDRPEVTPLRRHVAAQYEFYEWAMEGDRSPLLERCFKWLEEHWPAEEGPTVLSWGDARIGNTLYRGFVPVAVLDWEMAALGPREIDLAWFIFLHRFFEDLCVGYGIPGMPNFLRRDDVLATYEKLTGYTPRDVDFFSMYAATRHGIVMSRTARRQIHFGEIEMPADVDDLILHRDTLEAMLAGTYWAQVA